VQYGFVLLASPKSPEAVVLTPANTLVISSTFIPANGKLDASPLAIVLVAILRLSRDRQLHFEPKYGRGEKSLELLRIIFAMSKKERVVVMETKLLATYFRLRAPVSPRLMASLRTPPSLLLQTFKIIMFTGLVETIGSKLQLMTIIIQCSSADDG
jgi:hypothetical protein